MISSQYLFKMFRFEIDYSNYSKKDFDELSSWTITISIQKLLLLVQFLPTIHLWEKSLDLI